MGRKQTLAEKYQQAKSKESSTFAPVSVSEKSFLPKRLASRYNSPLKYQRKTLSDVYSSKAEHIPGSFGSPIRRVRISPRRNRLPAQLFKTVNGSKTPRPSQTPSNRIAKNSVNKAQGKGLLSRFKQFLTNFVDPVGSQKHDSYNVLRASLSSLPKESKQRQSAKPSPPRVNSYESKSNDAFDEVDMAIRERRQQEHTTRLELDLKGVKAELEKELIEKKELREEYDRKLYLLRKDFEARIFALEDELHHFAETANKSCVDLEKRTLANMEKAVLEQNQSFLIQRQQLLDLGQASEKRSDNHASTQQYQDKGSKKSGDDLQKPAFDHGDNIFSLKSSTRELQQTMKERLKKDLALEESFFISEKDWTESKLKSIQEKLLQLHDAMQTSYAPESLNQPKFQQKLEDLLLATNGFGSKQYHPEVAARLGQFSDLFNSYVDGSSKTPPDLRVIEGIEKSFKKVKSVLREKLTSKSKAFERLNDQVWGIDVVVNHQSFDKLEKTVSSLEAMVHILLHQRETLQLLLRINSFVEEISRFRNSTRKDFEGNL